jgi:mRNA deadenylase 3'-5' endonuclease subunit Ccr4
VPPAELLWSRRLGHMLQEIERHAPDVLALQEVDRLSDFLEPLSILG